MEFRAEQMSPPLRPRDGSVAVYEVDMGLSRTGWVIAGPSTDAAMIAAALNAEASRRSFNVLCADLMLGLDLRSPRPPSACSRSRLRTSGSGEVDR